MLSTISILTKFQRTFECNSKCNWKSFGFSVDVDAPGDAPVDLDPVSINLQEEQQNNLYR